MARLERDQRHWMDTFVSGGKSCLCMEAPENLASGNLSFINCGELCGKRVTYLTEHLFTKNCTGYRKYQKVWAQYCHPEVHDVVRDNVKR